MFSEKSGINRLDRLGRQLQRSYFTSGDKKQSCWISIWRVSLAAPRSVRLSRGWRTGPGNSWQTETWGQNRSTWSMGFSRKGDRPFRTRMDQMLGSRTKPSQHPGQFSRLTEYVKYVYVNRWTKNTQDLYPISPIISAAHFRGLLNETHPR